MTKILRHLMDEHNALNDLDLVLEIFQELEYEIRASGAIADKGTVIEVVPHSKSGKRYARKRITIDGKNNFVGCGQEGSEKHLQAMATLQRRNLLEQITTLIQQVEALKTSEDWQAISIQDQTIEQEFEDTEIVEPETLPVPEEPDSQFISFAFKGGKGATPENRVVHAVPGEGHRRPKL